MKIAVVTDDGKTVSAHFGRALHYLVFTVEEGRVIETELRDKVGHQQFVSGPHVHESHRAQGHGYGEHAEHRHAEMIEAIADCDAVLVRGMGRGAYAAIEQARIKAILTDIGDAEAAVQAYIDGTIVNHTDRLH
jgi:predicted Fe-Mo cluster-binding NifX family protein